MKKEQKVIVIESLKEVDINEKISEMNRNKWYVVNISSTEALFGEGSGARHTIILFERLKEY